MDAETDIARCRFNLLRIEAVEDCGTTKGTKYTKRLTSDNAHGFRVFRLFRGRTQLERPDDRDQRQRRHQRDHTIQRKRNHRCGPRRGKRDASQSQDAATDDRPNTDTGGAE